MGYDRTYTREEIHQMLYLSERRLRPSAPASKAHPGHAISKHSEQREDLFDRRKKVAQDSAFASRKDLVLAVEEALHSKPGQQVLAELNAHDVDSRQIVVQLSATLGKIRANVVQNPKPLGAQGPQHYLRRVLVTSIVVVVDKLQPAESWAPLHIQTAHPREFVS